MVLIVEFIRERFMVCMSFLCSRFGEEGVVLKGLRGVIEGVLQ